MKRLWFVVVLVAAAAVAAWFVSRPAPPKTIVVEEGGDVGSEPSEARPGELAAGPASARRDRPRDGRATGASQLSGTVRRAGAPLPAQVEAHWLSSVDANPFSRRKSGYFQRLLEAPPATRDATGSARAGDDGTYAIDGLAAGVYEVSATTDDGARGSVIASVAADGARVEANVDVEGGGESLTGRVVRADGTPWSGIVLVEPGNGSMRNNFPGLGGSSVSTRSDATGAFEAKGLRAGDVTVTAIEPGVFRVTSIGVKVPTAQIFVLTIDGGLAALKGRVLSDADGSPIAGAQVAGGGQGGGFSLFVVQTSSAADGSFELRVPAGPQSGVMVTAEGYAPGMWQGRGAKEGEPIEVRLAKTARVVGRVTRAGAEPVAGATVRAVPVGDRGWFSSAESVTTDADGRYDLSDVAPGDVMVVAEAKGLVTKGIADVSGQGYNPLAVPVKPGETTTIDVEMVAGAKASGTVTDAAGAPVRGAVVLAAGVANTPGAMRMDGSPGGPSAVTGADGAFVVDPLVPGKAYTFFAECAGFARCKSDAVTVTEAVPGVVALRFAPVRIAEISVLDDATGTGVAGARLTAQGVSGRRGGFMGAPPTWVTGADGRTKIGPLEAGDVRIAVAADDYVSPLGDATPTLPDGVATLVVRMKKGLPIAGKILLPDASPAVGAQVQIEYDGRSGRGWVQPVATGADGTFRLRGVLAGTVKLVASLGKDEKTYSGRATVTVGAEDVSITLEESGKGASGSKDAVSLVVRVLDADGKPVPAATAQYVTPDGGSNGTNVSDGKVTFTIQGKTGGKLSIWGARSRSGTPLPLAPARRDVLAAETDIEIRLAAGVSIEGTVRGPDGVGLRGVQVSAKPGPRDPNEESYGRGGWGSYATARTDAGGAFRLEGLAEEDYMLSVQAPAEFMRYDGPAVRGGTRGVDVSLKTGLSAFVTVVDDAGKPVVGANVSVGENVPDAGGRSRRGPTSRQLVTDAAGVARVAGLPPGGDFVLGVNAPDAIAWSQSPWAPADTVVHLERAYAISGVTKDSSGRPVPQVNVQWSKDKSGWSGTQSGADGRFRLQGLPAGEVYVRASIGMSYEFPSAPGAPRDAEKDTMRVRAGAKDVVLVVDVGLTLTVKFENWPADAPMWQRPQLTIEGAATRSIDGSPVDNVSPDGVATYRGLRDDETYRLAVTLPGGLCALVTGIKAGGETRVRLVPGKTITGRVSSPAGVDGAGVQATGNGVWVQGKVEADGRYVIEGLPDGTYDVTANCRKDGVWFQATGKVAAGGTLDLEPKKP